MAVIVNGKEVGVTNEGFVMPQLTDIQADVNDTLKSEFGADINLQATSFFGQISGIWSERESNIWQAMADVYASQDPDTAFGASLDNVGSLRGIPRLGARASTIQNVKLFGTPGTPIPATSTQFSVLNSPTSLFALNAAVVLGAGQNCIQTLTLVGGVPASGSFVLVLNGSQVTIQWNDNTATIQTKVRTLNFASASTVTGTLAGGTLTVNFLGAATGGLMVQPQFAISANTLKTSGLANIAVNPAITQAGIDQANVSCTATATGPVIANAGTLTVIATPISGLTNVLNVQDAIVGMDVEEDNVYRARMNQELQIAGAGTPEAIRAKLLQVPGVTSAIVFENVFAVVDINGLPAHSFQCFVMGGADADIALAIWRAKPAGIQSFGNISYTITDSQGLQHEIFFSRPTQVPIFIIANITVDLDYPVDGDTTVKQLLANFINSLGQGKDVIVVPQLVSSIVSVPGIVDAELLVGTSPGPTLSNNIPIGIQQIAIGDTGQVIVNHV